MDSELMSMQHHNGGVSSKPPVHHGSKRRGGRQGGGKGIKVVYISSPMMLTASAEEFRSVVQELTGRDSNVADHDLAHHHHAPSLTTYSNNSSWSSSSSSSYSSFGRPSSHQTTATAAAAAGARAQLMPQTMATATAGPAGLLPPEYAAGLAAAQPSSFQGMYDQTAGSLLYGQDYW